MKKNILFGLAAAALLSGCMYHLQPAMPEGRKTIAVPVFENDSGFPEIDAIATQYTLREIQREGSFTIRSVDNADLKLLGRLVRTATQPIAYDRNYEGRANEYRYTLTAKIMLIERSTGKILLNDVPVTASTTFLARDDMLTGRSDANPRVAKELARSIVDLVLSKAASK